MSHYRFDQGHLAYEYSPARIRVIARAVSKRTGQLRIERGQKLVPNYVLLSIPPITILGRISADPFPIVTEPNLPYPPLTRSRRKKEELERSCALVTPGGAKIYDLGTRI